MFITTFWWEMLVLFPSVLLHIQHWTLRFLTCSHCHTLHYFGMASLCLNCISAQSVWKAGEIRMAPSNISQHPFVLWFLGGRRTLWLTYSCTRYSGFMVFPSCFQEHSGRVFRLQFDEFQIISSSHDDTILIWDFLNVSTNGQSEGRSPSRTYTYISR